MGMGGGEGMPTTTFNSDGPLKSEKYHFQFSDILRLINFQALASKFLLAFGIRPSIYLQNGCLDEPDPKK